MNEETAIKIIEDYFEDKSSLEELQVALDYLVATQQQQPGLTKLYNELVLPGGIDCTTANELMLYYLDPVDKLDMSRDDRRSLLLHLMGCVECAEMYLSLVNEDLVSNASLETQPIVNNWPPQLVHQLGKILDTDAVLQFKITYQPAPATLSGSTRGTDPIRSGQLPTSASETIVYQGLVGTALTVQLKVSLQLISATLVNLRITLDPLSLPGELANHQIELRFAGNKLSKLTDNEGQVRFDNLPMQILENFEMEIKVQEND